MAMFFHDRYGLHDTQLTKIRVVDDWIDLEFGKGIYNLDSKNKEIDLTNGCHIFIQIRDPDIEKCVEIVEIDKGRLHPIGLAELQQMMVRSAFEVEFDFYSNFNNAMMLIGYIASRKVVFTIYESIDFKISFSE